MWWNVLEQPYNTDVTVWVPGGLWVTVLEGCVWKKDGCDRRLNVGLSVVASHWPLPDNNSFVALIGKNSNYVQNQNNPGSKEGGNNSKEILKETMLFIYF